MSGWDSVLALKRGLATPASVADRRGVAAVSLPPLDVPLFVRNRPPVVARSAALGKSRFLSGVNREPLFWFGSADACWLEPLELLPLLDDEPVDLDLSRVNVGREFEPNETLLFDV